MTSYIIFLVIHLNVFIYKPGLKEADNFERDLEGNRNEVVEQKVEAEHVEDETIRRIQIEGTGQIVRIVNRCCNSAKDGDQYHDDEKDEYPTIGQRVHPRDLEWNSGRVLQ